jgi:hypothetical protein
MFFGISTKNLHKCWRKWLHSALLFLELLLKLTQVTRLSWIRMLIFFIKHGSPQQGTLTLAHFIILKHLMSQPHFGQVWGWSPTLGKVGGLEPSRTPECSELDSKAQNTSHWDVLGVIGKVLKRKYRKWPRIGHSDICSLNYGQKKGQESNWQFDSWPLKVGNRPLPDVSLKSVTRRWKDLNESYNFDLGLVSIRAWSEELWPLKVPGVQPGQFRDSILGVPTKCAIWM